jgi:hypothetical protein
MAASAIAAFLGIALLLFTIMTNGIQIRKHDAYYPGNTIHIVTCISGLFGGTDKSSIL